MASCLGKTEVIIVSIRKFIVLDSVGNAGDLLWFCNKKINIADKVEKRPSEWLDIGEILITSGHFKSDGILLYKRKELNKEKINENRGTYSRFKF